MTKEEFIKDYCENSVINEGFIDKYLDVIECDKDVRGWKVINKNDNE